ncbi:30-kDa cleavage and polyadenylation specificity factor 30-like [Cucumis melo var. makuwa]|uniref:30-kDa cleavage and polyadenylation specificity factor 30-like n=1 Tax=Cucumis melo var. makuwa TaxID=1194695 RepID=A0A5D3BQI0_CUCMM|nr:30-kDa cleavage and polyadenylation specificity factor 30-like [Cucumis melo var. makuwa]
MEDSEGVLSFDFEGGLDAGPTNPAATSSLPLINSDSSAPPAASAVSNSLSGALGPAVSAEPPGAPPGNVGNRRSFRQTVCRHWLRSLCMKGDACGFLHQYDKSRMPICRFFRLYGECREQDCVYKHTNEDIKECNMYKFGFCPNGPDCRYRHAKLPGPPPPVEEILQKIQHLGSYNYGPSNKFFTQRGVGLSQQNEKSQFPQVPAITTQGVTGKPSAAESANVQQQQGQQSAPQASQTPVQNLSNGQPNQLNRNATSLPQGISSQSDSAFSGANHSLLWLCKDDVQDWWICQWGQLEICTWNCTLWAKLFAQMAEDVFAMLLLLLVFFTAANPITGNFFGLCYTVQIANVAMLEGLPRKDTVQISRDCQELEPSIGEQLASLLYLEPDGELMARKKIKYEEMHFGSSRMSAESKREEEKAKGVNPDIGSENPDIVPFEDNEEEEEEESEEEEEESFGQSVGLPPQGRGRGRGMMWPPQMPIGRGARPFHGMQGFPPGMMGPDGLSYGPVTPDGFPMPDIFGMAPRGFGPYGPTPRFSSDFMGPPTAMMFRGRPSQPGAMFPPGGFGMMMGQGRGGPFMGGMGVTGANPARPGRPVGVSPLYPPPAVPSSQNMNRAIKRDQRGLTNDKYIVGIDQNKGLEIQSSGRDDEMQYKQGSKAYSDEQYGTGTTFRNEESESEDEAPRRSRHGEGKKKRRGSEGDATAISNQ